MEGIIGRSVGSVDRINVKVGSWETVKREGTETNPVEGKGWESKREIFQVSGDTFSIWPNLESRKGIPVTYGLC